jgi:hypothetical protein
MKYTEFVSEEALEIIRNNECEAQIGSLATARFRRLWNAIENLREENAVLNALLKERQKVLDAIPPCPTHGECVPHALGWITRAKSILHTIKAAVSDIEV